MDALCRSRLSFFIADGRLDLDLVVDFLETFNAMIDHQPKPFKKLIDQKMKL